MLELHKEVEFCNLSVDLTPHPLAQELPRKPTVAQIRRLQDVLATLPQIETEPAHYFADGMYGRELFIPAGSVVVGKMHRHEHLVQLLSGEATVYTDNGMERIVGPRTWVSPPGVKRALMTHTDCLFFTVHLNPENTRDLEAIEADVIVPELLAHEVPELAEFADELQGVYA